VVPLTELRNEEEEPYLEGKLLALCISVVSWWKGTHEGVAQLDPNIHSRLAFSDNRNIPGTFHFQLMELTHTTLSDPLSCLIFSTAKVVYEFSKKETTRIKIMKPS
jgi:hypothetical protein